MCSDLLTSASWEVPNVAPVVNLPDSLPEGIAPSESRTFKFHTFGLGLEYRCLKSHLGSWTQLVVRGRGGVRADNCRAVPCRSRALRFLGRFGMDPLFRCAYRSSGKALTVQGQSPFHRRRAPFGTPRPGGHARGTGLPAGGGACKGAAGCYRGHFGPAE